METKYNIISFEVGDSTTAKSVSVYFEKKNFSTLCKQLFNKSIDENKIFYILEESNLKGTFISIDGIEEKSFDIFEREFPKVINQITILNDRYVVAFPVIEQYTEGITGQNIFIYIIAGDYKLGFPNKKEAKLAYDTFAREGKFKSTKTSAKLGMFFNKPEIMTFKELDNKSNVYYYRYGTKIYYDAIL